MLTEAEQRELDELELMELDALEASYQQADSEPAIIEEIEETPMTPREEATWETGEVQERSFLDEILGEERKIESFQQGVGDFVDRGQASFAEAGADVLELGKGIYDSVTGQLSKEWDSLSGTEKEERVQVDWDKNIKDTYADPVMKAQIQSDIVTSNEEAREDRNRAISLIIQSARDSDAFYGVDEGSKRQFSEFKNADGILNKAIILSEVAIGDIVDSSGQIATMVINAPAAATALGYKEAQVIAKNKGYKDPTAEDLVLGMSSGFLQTYLQKVTMTQALKADTFKKLGTASFIEGAGEVPAELYSGFIQNIGTGKDLTAEEIEETAIRAFTAGTGTGAAIGIPGSTVGEGKGILRRKRERVARKAEADAKVQEKLDNIKNVNLQNEQVLAQGTNRQAFIDAQIETGTIQTPVQAAELQRQADIDAASYAAGDVRASNLTPDAPIAPAPITMPEMEVGITGEPTASTVGVPVGEITGDVVAEAVVPEVTPFQEETTTAARTRQQAIDEEFQEGARSRGVGGTITPEADLAQEFRTEEATAKRDKEDVTQTVVSNKIKRKQARAQRVLDDPASSNEAVERAEETLIEADEDVAMAQVKRREQEVKRKKEDGVQIREGFLEGDRKVTGRKKNELIQIAESLGLDVQPTKGKKSVSVTQYREAIATHPDVVIADVKPTADVVDAAFKPIAKEEAVEAPVETVAPVTKVTPTPTITEERVKTELTLDADGVTVVDQDGMPVEQSPKVRARFFKKIDKVDPELLTEADRGLTDLQKAEKRLRSLEYQDQAQTEQGGLTPKQVEEKGKLEAKIEKLRKDEVEAVAKKAAEETVRVEQEKAAAPEGATVEGQAEVDVVEAVIDEEAAPDIEVEEAPTAESTIAAGLKQMIKEEVAAQTGTPITKEEAVEEDFVSLTERQEDQLDGWSRAGIDESIIDIAENNTALLDAVDVLTAQYKKDGMAGREAFLKAVAEVTGSPEMALPSFVTDTSEVATKELPKKPRTTKAKIEEVWKDRWGTVFSSKVSVVDSFTDLPLDEQNRKADSTAMAWYVPAKDKIYIVADRVPEGYEEGLVLHELGVHQLLKKSDEYLFVVENMERMLKAGDRDVVQAYKIARQNNPDKSEALIQEEAIAYLMSHHTKGSAFRTLVRTLKAMVKGVLGFNMSTEDIIILVNSMTHDAAKAEVEVGAEYAARIAEGLAAVAEVTEEIEAAPAPEMTEFDPNVDYNATTEEKVVMKEAVDEDINASENEWYQGTVANSPRTFFQRVWDVSQTEGTIAAVKAATTHVTDKPLKAWIPQSHLIRQAKEAGLNAIAELETVADKARQEAQENIDYAIENVVKPARSLAQTNRPEYLKVVQMLHNATYNNKDMKKSAEFGRLSEEAQAVYKEVEAHYKKQGQLMLESMAVALDTENLSDANKVELKKYINTFRHTLNNTVYFPMQRFGSRRITAHNEALGRHVEFMDHTSEIIEAKKELMKMGYAEGDIKIGLVDNLQDDARVAMDRNVFDKAQSIISNMEGNEKAQEALWRTFMAMAPSNKLKDRMSRRRFVKGASNRMAEGLNRSTSQFFETAQRRHSPERSEMLRDADAELDAMPQVTPEEIRNHKKAEDILKEVKLREKMQGQVRAKWSSNLSKANFFVHLGFNMSSAIINLTQNVIVGVPVLAAKHPAGKVATEMSKQFVNATKILGGGKPYESGSPQSNAFIDLQHRGAINLTQAQMLQDISESDRNMIRDGVGEKVMAASAFMFHKAEVANRITAAMTSFNLNYDGTNYQESIEQAIKDTREIHFDYSEEGKSRIQRGDIGGVALAFKSYPIQMAWYMASNIKKSMWFTEGTTEEKKAARTKIIGTLLMTQLFAGAMGLPTSSLFHMLADMLMEDEDDAHEMFKEFLRDNLGEELGDAVRMGVIGQMTGVNLSSRTSLDQMFFRIPQGEAKAADWGKSLMEASVGPIGARLSTIPKGVDLMLEGKALAGMEAFMPAIYTNLSRATRWGAEGQANNAYDDLVEKDFSAYDAILKGIGFSSSEYQDTSEDLWIGKRTDATISRQKRVALRDMAIAVIQGDGSDRSAARRAIREWNRAHTDDKISQSTIKRRVKDLRKKLRGEI